MQNRLGDAADAGLQSSAVGDERGHVARHAHVHLRSRLGFKLEQRPVGLHNSRYAAEGNGGIAMGARHLPVHFRNHDGSAAQGRLRAVHRRAQGHETVRIRRRYLHQHHVERQSAALKEAFDFTQKDGRVVGPAIAHRFAHILAQKQAAMTEVARVLRPRVGGGAERLHMDDFDVAKLGRPGHQRIDKRRRRSAARLNPDASARLYGCQRLRGAHALALVILGPGHLEPPPHIHIEACVGA